MTWPDAKPRAPHASRPAAGTLAPLRLTSGDGRADSRFQWAEGAWRDGDAAAAADLYAQCLELAPAFLPAVLGLARARLALGDAAGAAEAARMALALDPSDPLGAGLVLARAAPGQDPFNKTPALSDAFVAGLFDAYAPRFDAHLTGALGYRGPAVVEAALLRACAGLGREPRFRRAVDLGCGTGLMGAAIRPRVETLVGVDLSPLMVEAARSAGHYDALHVAEVRAFLAGEAPGSAALALAADVLVYVAKLEPVFRELARVLEPGGLFAATVQDGGEAADDAGGTVLGPDDRFASSRAGLERAFAAAGLEAVLLEPASTRLDAGRPVPGFVFVARRPLEAGGTAP